MNIGQEKEKERKREQSGGGRGKDVDDEQREEKTKKKYKVEIRQLGSVKDSSARETSNLTNLRPAFEVFSTNL